MSPLPPVYGIPTSNANQIHFTPTARSLALAPASPHIQFASMDNVRFGMAPGGPRPRRRPHLPNWARQRALQVVALGGLLTTLIAGAGGVILGSHSQSSQHQATKTSQTATATPAHSAADTARFNALFNKNKKDFTPSDIQFVIKYIDGNNVNVNTIYSANIDQVLNSHDVKALDPKGTSDLVQILQKMDWAVRQVSTPGHQAYYTPQDLAAIAHYGDPSCGITVDKANHILQIIKNWHCHEGATTPTPGNTTPTPTPKPTPPSPTPTPCPVFNNQSAASYENIIAVLGNKSSYTQQDFVNAENSASMANAKGSTMEVFFQKMAYFMGEYNITSVNQAQIKSLAYQGNNQDVITSSTATGSQGDNVTDSVDFIPAALGWDTASANDLLPYLQQATGNPSATSFNADNIAQAGNLAAANYQKNPGNIHDFVIMTVLNKLAYQARAHNHNLTTTDLQTLVNDGTPGGVSISDADGAPGFLGW